MAREGGHVDDPDDPGGATNHGVTLATYRRVGRDRDGDGRITAADVARITVAEAVEIYLEHYWRRPGLSALPEAVQPNVFDMHVNAGAQAVRILQRLVGVVPDGVVGPRTVAAAAARGPGLAEDYGIARRDYYYRLADARPASRKYVRRRDGGKGGWILRAESFLPPHLHLSEAAHRARVAAWR